MRLFVDGKSTRTISMFTEAQIVADTGAETEVRSIYNGVNSVKRILPRAYVVDDALAGIEFVSALEVKE